MKKEYTLKIKGVDTSIKDITKLNDVVLALDASLQKAGNTSVKVTGTAKEHAKAITEEEKAAKKLEETQKKIKAAREGANDAQIKANQALREATREQMLRVKAERASANSIEAMRGELSRLKDEWKGMDVGTEGFRAMSEEIRVLNDRIKEAEQSTGDFRRNVGNYESALDGLGKLSEGIEGATKSSMGLAQSLMGGLALMSLFGDKSEENAEKTRQLQKIIALLSIAQNVNNNLLKQGIVQNKAAAAIDKVRAVQLKAKAAAEAASTKGTVAATAAQKVFNAVASANPYVLLALAIVSVAGALVMFAKNTNTAKSAEEKHKQALDALTQSIDANNKELSRRNSILKAMGASELTIISGTVDAIRKSENAARGALDDYLLDVKNKRVKYDAEIHKSLEDTWKAQKDALDNAQTDRDNYYRNIETRLRNHGKTELQLRAEQYEEDRKAAAGNTEMLKLLEEGYQLDVQEIRKRNAQKTAGVAKAERDAVKAERDKLIKDLENYGKTELQLLDEKYDKEYALLEDNAAAQNRLTRKYQDERKAIIEKTEQEIANAAKQAAADRMSIVDLELANIEFSLEKFKNKVDEVVVRDKTGLELIDVEATRKNLADTNDALDKYIQGLTGYLDSLKDAHEETLATLQEGTPQYEAELLNYASTVEDVTQRIKNAQDEQVANTKRSAGLQMESLIELFDNIAEFADKAAAYVSSVMGAWNAGIQVQLDGMNEQLDALNERYDEAVKQREEAAKHVEDIEAQMQAATGGTAEALKEQLQDAMHARGEAEREEQRLAREKEKREAQIAKKEKQMRRNELMANIAQAVANTAQGITKALTLVFPLNLAVAAIVGAMGGMQVSTMTKQLTKLADGGEIKGPSHADGGVRIPGTNYEVEGGEFVVNKRSYGANTNLVNFINDTPRMVTAADLIGVVPGDTTPVAVSDAGTDGEDRIVEAINGINIRPVVSVTDINNVGDDMVTVEDLVGV